MQVGFSPFVPKIDKELISKLGPEYKFIQTSQKVTELFTCFCFVYQQIDKDDRQAFYWDIGLLLPRTRLRSREQNTQNPFVQNYPTTMPSSQFIHSFTGIPNRIVGLHCCDNIWYMKYLCKGSETKLMLLVIQIICSASSHTIESHSQLGCQTILPISPICQTHLEWQVCHSFCPVIGF